MSFGGLPFLAFASPATLRHYGKNNRFSIATEKDRLKEEARKLGFGGRSSFAAISKPVVLVEI